MDCLTARTPCSIDHCVMEVAHAVGLSNVSHFRRTSGGMSASTRVS
jgi:hypothetical protein